MRWQQIVVVVASTGSLMLGAGAARADEPTSMPTSMAVSIILDCSRSMEQPLAANTGLQEASDRPEVTRMEAAHDLVQSALGSFVTHGQEVHLGLWLLGHRLAWEDAEQPDLQVQHDYLAQTNGFAVLQNLVPGDDVELVRHVRLLKTEHVHLLAAQLRALKPWGESPVYLALSRAIDEFGSQAKNEHRGIILITDSGNEQWRASQNRTHKDVLALHMRRRVPVHVIGLGLSAEEHRGPIGEYQEIAHRTRGSFQQADSVASLNDAFSVALKRISNPEDAVDAVATDDPISATPVGTTQGRALQKSRIDGVVMFQDSPVKNATVKVAGAVSVGVKTDKTGAFVIKHLPPGVYDLSVEGIARNKIRETTVKVTVQAPPAEPPFIEAELR